MGQNIENFASSEKRGKPRVECDYLAIVKGQDAQGKRFEEIARINNLSANGLYMRLQRTIFMGEELFVTIFLHNRTREQTGPKITTTGIVVRTEQPREGTTVGIALKILDYRFM
jgi:hypothetical protein